MKNKLIFLSIFILSIFIANNILININANNTLNLSLLNIEALARNEGDDTNGGEPGITCGRYEGRCWYILKHSPFGVDCKFSGYYYDYCVFI